MAALTERQIDEMVKELVDDVLQPNDTTSQDKKDDAVSVETSVEPEVKSPSVEQPESKQSTPPTSSNKDDKKEPDINKMINGLFSNLVDSFIPPELKQNKDLNKMMSLIMTSFAPNQNKPKDDETKTESNSQVKEKKSDKFDEKEQSDKSEQTDDSDDQSDESVCSDDSDDQNEGSESDDQTEESDVTDQSDFYDETEVDTELNEDESVYVVLHNNMPLGYAHTYNKAKNYMVYLYNKYMFSNKQSFLRTVRKSSSNTVYEREPFTIFPYNDKIATTFCITTVAHL
jgi:hypothetical protein